MVNETRQEGIQQDMKENRSDSNQLRLKFYLTRTSAITEIARDIRHKPYIANSLD